MAIDELVEEGKEELKSASRSAKRYLEEAGEHWKAGAEDAWDDMAAIIRKHPGKAIAFTLMAGAAVGSLMVAMNRRGGRSASLRNLADTGVDAWDRVKEGFGEAASALRDALEEASGKFK